MYGWLRVILPENRKIELEPYWKGRLLKAKVDLDAVRARVESLKHDTSCASSPDGGYSYAG